MQRSSGQSSKYWEVADAQYGAVSHEQLRALGWSDDEIFRRLRDRLHQVHRGVYAVGRPELSREGRWMAAVLACGEGAALSHESAAALFGILDEDPGRPHVSVEHPRNPKHPRIKIHRRTPMPPVRAHKAIPAVEPWRVLLDLAPPRSLMTLDGLVNNAERLGLIVLDDAMDELPKLAGRPGVRKLHQVLQTHQSTGSGLERVFLRIAREAGLPSPDTQVALFGYRVDFFWPALRLVVETDGLTWHRTPEQQARDRLRDQTLTAAGFTCLRFTNQQVRRAPNEVTATLRAVAARLRPLSY